MIAAKAYIATSENAAKHTVTDNVFAFPSMGYVTVGAQYFKETAKGGRKHDFQIILDLESAAKMRDLIDSAIEKSTGAALLEEIERCHSQALIVNEVMFS